MATRSLHHERRPSLARQAIADIKMGDSQDVYSRLFAGIPSDVAVLAVLRDLRRKYGGLVPLRLLYETITLDIYPRWMLSPAHFIRISNSLQILTPLDVTADVTNTFKKTVEIAIYGPRWDDKGKTDMRSCHDMPYNIEPMSEDFALWFDKTMREEIDADILGNKLPFCNACLLTPAIKFQHCIMAVREPERVELSSPATPEGAGLKSRGEVDLKVFVFATPLCDIYQCEYTNEFEKEERFSVWMDWVRTKNKYNRWEMRPWLTMYEEMEKCVDNMGKEWENLVPDLRNPDEGQGLRSRKLYASKANIMKREGTADPMQLVKHLKKMEDQMRQNGRALEEMGIVGFGFHDDEDGDEGGEERYDEDGDEDGDEEEGQWDPEQQDDDDDDEEEHHHHHGHVHGGGHIHRHVDDVDDDSGSEVEGLNGQRDEEEMEQ